MDKFINKENISDESTTGLNLLCDPKKLKKCSNKEILKGKTDFKFINSDYLDSFKKFIKNKIRDFNPTIKKDSFDTLLVALWHQYIFQNVDTSKYSDFVKILNSNVEILDKISAKSISTEDDNDLSINNDFIEDDKLSSKIPSINDDDK